MTMRLLVVLLFAAACTPGGEVAPFTLPTEAEALPAAVAVRGTLDTAGHLAAAGREVVLLDAAGGARTAKTDDAGAFVFTGVARGAWSVEIDLPGFKLLRQRFEVGTADVDLGSLKPEWFAADPAGGNVTTLGLVAASPGVDVTAAIVELRKDADVVAVARPSSDGSFSLTTPPGTWTLRATHPLCSPAEDKQFVVPAGAPLNDARAKPLALVLNAATVSGSVEEETESFDRATGRISRGTQPAQGATVTAVVGDRSSPTAADGSFSLDGLPGVANTLRFSKPDRHAEPASLAVSPAPGAKVNVGVATVLKLDRGSISGSVTLADGKRLASAVVAVSGAGYQVTVSAAPDAADPSRSGFFLPDVPVGTYELSAYQDGYAPSTVSGVKVTRGQTVVAGDLRLAQLAGDFAIDDADATNEPGFVKSTSVSLTFSNVTGAACIRVAESSAAVLTATCQPWTGGAVSYVLGGGASGYADGRKTVYAQYETAAGSASKVFSSAVVLDRTAPAISSLTLEGGKPFTRSSSVLSVGLAAADVAPAGVSAQELSGVARLKVAADAASLAAAPPQAFATTFPFARATTADGLQSVHVLVVDRAGNASAPVSADVVVDTRAPAGTIAVLDGPGAVMPGFTNTPAVRVTRTYDREPLGGRVSVRLANAQADLPFAREELLADCTATPCALAGIPWNLEPTPLGTKQVWAQFVDSAGNTSAPVSASVKLDPTPPAVTLTLKSPVVTNQLQPLVAVTVTDDTQLPAEPLLLADSAAIATATPRAAPSGDVAVTLQPVGKVETRTLVALVRDAAGNTARAEVQVRYDAEPPSGTLAINGGAASTTTNAVTLAVAASPDTKSLHVVERDAAAPALACSSSLAFATPAAATLSFNLSAEGQRAVDVCLKDEAGNVQPAPLTARILYDGTKPTGTVAIADGPGALMAGFTSTTAAKLTLTYGKEPAGGRVSVRLAHAQADLAFAREELLPDCATAPCTLAGLAWTLDATPGTKQVFAQFVDSAGNASVPVSATIKLDPTPPAVTLTLKSPAVTNLTQPLVAVTVTDGTQLPAQPLWLADSAQLATTAPRALPSGDVAVTLTPLGAVDTRTVVALAKDAAGNTARAEVQVKYDAEAPFGTLLINGGAASTTTNAVTLGLSASPDTKAVHLVERAASAPALACTASLAYATPAAATIPFNLAQEGSRAIDACLKDEAGNVQPAALTAKIVFDATKPIGTIAVTGYKASGATSSSVTASPRVDVSWVGAADGGEAVVGRLEMILSEDPSFAGAAWQPYAAKVGFLLSPGDGPKTVYGQLRDPVGNTSVAATASPIRLDTTPPVIGQFAFKQGAFTTGYAVDLLVSAADGGSGGALDALPLKLVEGTTDFAAAGARALVPGSPVSFTLAGSGPVEETRVVNGQILDAAGNAATASASVRLDTLAPPKPTVSVRNFDGKATAVLNNPPAGVVAARLDYGAVDVTGVAETCSGSRGGDFAAEGPSPLLTAPGSGTLSGLSNGVPAFAVACWVDEAGNVGPASDQFVLQPNEVPMSLVHTTPVLASGDGRRLVVNGSWLYLLGVASGVPTLQVLDASKIVSPLQATATSPARGPVAVRALSFADLAESAYRTVDLAMDGPYLFVAGGSKVKVLSLAKPGDPAVVTTIELQNTTNGGPINYGAWTGAYGGNYGPGCSDPGALRIQAIAVRGTTLVVSGTSNFVLTVDLGALYDRNPATLPSSSSLVGISCPRNGLDQSWAVPPHALKLTRDRLHLLHTTTDSLGLNMADALDNNAATVWDTRDWMATADLGRGWVKVPSSGAIWYTQGLGSGELQSQPVVSGNYLYATMQSFQVFELNSLWSGSTSTVTSADLVASLGVKPTGQLQVVGGQLFASDIALKGVRALDLTDVSAPRETALYRSTSTAARQATAASGNYFFAGRADGVLETYELAAPTQLRVATTGTGATSRGEIDGGFFYSGNGAVFDLQHGWPLRAENTLPYGYDCSLDGARFDEAMVSVKGNRLTLLDLDKVTDRRTATVFNPVPSAPMAATDDAVDVFMPAGTRVTAAEALGNYLVVAELRGDGTWVEVFDARTLRDRIPRAPRLSGFSLASSLGAVKVSTYTSPTAWADLHLSAGRAVVTLDESGYAPAGAPPATGFFIADIRALLDDDSATTPGTQYLQGSLNLTRAREAVVRGNFAAVATEAGVALVDVTQAFDEDPATTTLTVDYTIPVARAEAVTVSGSWLLAYSRTYGAAGVRAWDLTPYFATSGTRAPALASYYATSAAGYQCSGTDRYEIVRTKVVLAGSRAYATANISDNQTTGGSAPSLVVFELK